MKVLTAIDEGGRSNSAQRAANRWTHLLQHPHFRQSADLSLGPRSRQLQTSLAQPSPADSRFENTTPLGREIIRKELWRLKQDLKRDQIPRRIQALRELLPNHALLACACKSDPSARKRVILEAASELLETGRAEAVIVAERELATACMDLFPEIYELPSAWWDFDPEAEETLFWHDLAVSVQSLSRMDAGGLPVRTG